jgi:hypothetical protein
MSIAGYSFTKEGFFNFNSNPVTKNDIDNNINTLQEQSNNLNISDSKINSNYYDLSNNISNYNSQRAYMQMDNSKNITKYNRVYNNKI